MEAEFQLIGETDAVTEMARQFVELITKDGVLAPVSPPSGNGMMDYVAAAGMTTHHREIVGVDLEWDEDPDPTVEYVTVSFVVKVV